MADRLTFPMAELLSFKRTPDGGTAQFSSSITKAVASAMEWADIPECFTGGDLEGELAASTVELTPKDESLKRFAISLDTKLVYKFETVRRELEGKQGKGHRTELRFKVDFTDIKGARKLEEFMLTAGKCSVTVSYQKQARQGDLPGTEPRGDDNEALPLQ